MDNASDIRNFKFTCKLIVSTKYLCLSKCHLCNSTHEDIFCHVTFSCHALSDCHNEWWNTIVNSFHIDLGAELCVLCETDLFLVVLGREPLSVLPLSQERNFRIRNCLFVHEHNTNGYVQRSCEYGLCRTNGTFVSLDHFMFMIYLKILFELYRD